ncbi:MAG: hypothetical protein LCH61_12640 [Proteobacteria bacterium]|nr:hypothetical protein [Pseudomonadota bacterium]
MLKRSMLAAVATFLLASAASAQQVIEYRLSFLTSAQRVKLDRYIENYALAEALVSTCGSPTGFEMRVRRAANGCIAKESLDTVATKFRSLVAASVSRGKWRCGDADVARFAAEMRRALDLTIGDIRNACLGNRAPPDRVSQ